MPITWIAAFLLLALFLKKSKYKKRSLRIGVILLLFFTNPFLANEALLLWEKDPTPINTLGEYDIGIVLTGVTSQRNRPNDRVFFDKGADRVLHTIQLYKLGKIKKILISGGSGKISRTVISEAATLKKVFLTCGIPESDLILEEKSRNTRESAYQTAKIIKQKYPNNSFILITSAFHMRRAEACYNKEGIKTVIYPVDYYGIPRSFTLDQLLIPSEKSIWNWHKLIREITGYIVYSLAGYTT